MAADRKRRANGEGTLYEDEARGVWVAQKYVRTIDGRLKRVTARGRTQGEARQALRARERQTAASHMSAEKMTVEAYLGVWLEHKAAATKARTVREYWQVFAHHVIPAIGHYPLAKLRPMHVQRAIDSVARAGKRTTAHNARRYLSQALEQAVRWELIDKSPMHGVSRVEVETPKRGLWDVTQTGRFLEVARERTWYYPMLLVAVVTGLRQGELVSLPWSNVSPEGVRVDRTWSKDELVGYDTPKTRNAYRDVPISEDVYMVLRARQAAVGGPWAFPTADGTMPSPYNAYRAFRSVTLAAGLEPIRFHDLRRIAATSGCE